MMSKQNWLIGLVFLLALSLWRWYAQPQDTQSSNVNAIYQPNFTARNLHTLNYDAQGRLKRELAASYVEHYETLDMTELQEPRITTRDAQGQPAWFLQSHNGVLNKGDNVILRSQVQLQNLQPNPMVQHLQTDYVEFDLTNQQIRTNLLVTMEGPDFHNQGVGLFGKLDQNTYELLGDSHAIYFNPPR